MDIKILENLLQVTIERGNLCNRHDQIIYKRIMVDLGLLKSGKVELQSTIDRGNLRKLLGNFCKKLPLIVKNLFSTEMRIPKGTERRFTMDRGNLRQCITKNRLIPKIFVMGSDAAEFVNKVKDQVRNRQKRMSSIAESCNEHSIIWGMFMAATLNAATFMGKNFSTIQSFIKNYEDLTLKQMFDVTAQLVNDQEEIHGLDKIQWEKDSWKRLSLVGDETVINLQSTKVYVFSDSVLCLGRILQHPDSNEAWKNRVAGARSEKSYRDNDAINGESTEFELNIFPGFTTLQLCDKISDLLSDLGETPETSQEEFYLCRCSITFLVTEKATKMNAWQMPESSKYLREDLVLDSGHLLDQVLKRSGILQRIVHKELGVILRKKCCWNSQKADILLPCNDSIVQGSTQEQRTWKAVDTLRCR